MRNFYCHVCIATRAFFPIKGNKWKCGKCGRCKEERKVN